MGVTEGVFINFFSTSRNISTISLYLTYINLTVTKYRKRAYNIRLMSSISSNIKSELVFKALREKPNKHS